MRTGWYKQLKRKEDTKLEETSLNVRVKEREISLGDVGAWEKNRDETEKRREKYAHADEFPSFFHSAIYVLEGNKVLWLRAIARLKIFRRHK